MISFKDQESLKTIIRSAGAAIMEEYEKHNPDIIIKSDQSPLTNADLRSNEIINEGLKSLDKVYPIISEENELLSAEERQAFETVWIVDPMDGTKEFIKKNGEFAICIALVHKQRAVAGFVYAPDLDELYYGVKDQGAILEKEGTKTELQAPFFNPQKKQIRIGISRSHQTIEQNEFNSKYNNPVLIPKGSILKITEIARNKIDIYPRLDQKTKEWDIAAGQIILEEAGGQVVHLLTGKPILYNKVNMANQPFIARGRPS